MSKLVLRNAGNAGKKYSRMVIQHSTGRGVFDESKFFHMDAPDMVIQVLYEEEYSSPDARSVVLNAAQMRELRRCINIALGENSPPDEFPMIEYPDD